MTQDEIIEAAIQGHSSTRDAIRWAINVAETQPKVKQMMAQRTWVGLIRGVRVEGDTVVISVKGGNDAARELCSELLNEMGVRNGA